MTPDYTFERQIMLKRKEGYKEGFIIGCKERGLSYDAVATKVKKMKKIMREMIYGESNKTANHFLCRLMHS